MSSNCRVVAGHNREAADMLVGLLGAMGHAAITAYDGREAVAACSASSLTSSTPTFDLNGSARWPRPEGAAIIAGGRAPERMIHDSGCPERVVGRQLPHAVEFGTT